MPDGRTQREHLAALAKRGRADMAALLAQHPCPPAFRQLSEDYDTLAMWRGVGGFGPSPLTLADVDAYERRFGRRFLPGELDLVKRLDLIDLTPPKAH